MTCRTPKDLVLDPRSVSDLFVVLLATLRKLTQHNPSEHPKALDSTEHGGDVGGSDAWSSNEPEHVLDPDRRAPGERSYDAVCHQAGAVLEREHLAQSLRPEDAVLDERGSCCIEQSLRPLDGVGVSGG